MNKLHVWKTNPYDYYVGELVSEDNGVWIVKTSDGKIVYETIIGAEIVDWKIKTIQLNAQLLADMIGVSSITSISDEWTQDSSGMHSVFFTEQDIEFRMIVEDADPNIEKEQLLKEVDVLTSTIDQQLDVLDPGGASFLVKSREWFRRKKKRSDAIDPAATLLCGDRILKRLQMMKRIRELEK